MGGWDALLTAGFFFLTFTQADLRFSVLNYAGDPVSTMPYVGVNGGMVIVSAGDPSVITSPNEQDQRHFTGLFHNNIHVEDFDLGFRIDVGARFYVALAQRAVPKHPVADIIGRQLRERLGRLLQGHQDER